MERMTGVGRPKARAPRSGDSPAAFSQGTEQKLNLASQLAQQLSLIADGERHGGGRCVPLPMGS
jgi:ABC-type phosphonate transport system ATPase subunit